MESIQTIAGYAFVGAALGEAIGSGAGIASIPLTCNAYDFATIVFNKLFTNNSSEVWDKEPYAVCQIWLPRFGSIAGALAGTVAGITFDPLERV